jgi:hypothetical protein
MARQQNERQERRAAGRDEREYLQSRSQSGADKIAAFVEELKAQREHDQRYRETVRRYRAGGRGLRGRQ